MTSFGIPYILVLGVAIGLLSSLMPYSFELIRPAPDAGSGLRHSL